LKIIIAGAGTLTAKKFKERWRKSNENEGTCTASEKFVGKEPQEDK